MANKNKSDIAGSAGHELITIEVHGRSLLHVCSVKLEEGESVVTFQVISTFAGLGDECLYGNVDFMFGVPLYQDGHINIIVQSSGKVVLSFDVHKIERKAYSPVIITVTIRILLSPKKNTSKRETGTNINTVDVRPDFLSNRKREK